MRLSGILTFFYIIILKIIGNYKLIVILIFQIPTFIFYINKYNKYCYVERYRSLLTLKH